MKTALMIFLLLVAPVACESWWAPGDETPSSAGGSGGVNRPQHQEKPYVVVVSFDGFRHDYLERFDTPNLDRFEADGIRADALIPVYPVKTFPNHYSIATGLYPANHGIVGNEFYDPDRDKIYSVSDRASVSDGSWYGGEPFWVTAERQGMVSASFFWVGTEAPVGGIQPTFWFEFDAGVPNDERVDTVVAWLRLPPEQRPHIITLYFEETDDAGHNGAVDSDRVRRAVGEMDRLAGRLLSGIESLPHGGQVNIVIVSDHGMSPFYSDRFYHLRDMISLEGVRTFEAGAHMVLYVDGNEARISSLGEELDALMPHAAVYRVGDVPKRLHYEGPSRLGDLVIVPELGWFVVPWSEAQRPPFSGWTHGWDPASTDMHGIFLAKGPGVRASGRIPAFENVHIYPLLVALLGLDPAPFLDGDPSVLGSHRAEGLTR